jgi:hypothetical protein
MHDGADGAVASHLVAGRSRGLDSAPHSGFDLSELFIDLLEVCWHFLLQIVAYAFKGRLLELPPSPNVEALIHAILRARPGKNQ